MFNSVTTWTAELQASLSCTISWSLPRPCSNFAICPNNVLHSEVKSLSHVRLFATPWTVAHGLLGPWDFPGKSTGVGCHFLLQGIFLTQGSNPGLPHCRQMLYHLSHQGSPSFAVEGYNSESSSPCPSCVSLFSFNLGTIPPLALTFMTLLT